MLKHTGSNIGKSIYEHDCENLIKEIFEKSKLYNCQINCPIDVVVAKSSDEPGKNKNIKENKR